MESFQSKKSFGVLIVTTKFNMLCMPPLKVRRERFSAGPYIFEGRYHIFCFPSPTQMPTPMFHN